MMQTELDYLVAEGVGPVQLRPLPPAPPPGSNLGPWTVGNTPRPVYSLIHREVVAQRGLVTCPTPHSPCVRTVLDYGVCDSWASVATFSRFCLSGVARGVGAEMRGCFGKQLTPLSAWTAA